MPFQTPVPIVPTLVKLELTTAEPSVVALNTDTLLILNTLPVAIFQFSLEVQLVFARSQLIVLSVAPLSVIPPPSAVVSVGVTTLPISIFLSRTCSVVLFKYSVVPLTVNVPLTVKLLLTVVVPVLAPILIDVPAPAKFTVVAVVFNRSKLVLAVVRLVVIAGLVPNTFTPVPVLSVNALDKLAELGVVRNAGTLVPRLERSATTIARNDGVPADPFGAAST